jgi:hypothetical protein
MSWSAYQIGGGGRDLVVSVCTPFTGQMCRLSTHRLDVLVLQTREEGTLLLSAWDSLNDPKSRPPNR